MTEAWTQQEAIELCKKIEAECPRAGCHVALTGGCLYRDGDRKDLDLIFYRIRQTTLDTPRLLNILVDLGFKWITGSGWRYVGYYFGKKVDLLFPEAAEGEYPPPGPASNPLH